MFLENWNTFFLLIFNIGVFLYLIYFKTVFEYLYIYFRFSLAPLVNNLAP